jgi:cytochrome P450
LKKLNYIDLIQNETLRYYGPGNGVFDRMAMKDHLVEDIPISKGTLIGVQPMGNHYKEEYFKDPYEFRPERW